MMDKTNQNKEEANKGIISKMIDKLDKKLEEKSKKNKCCHNNDKEGGCSC